MSQINHIFSFLLYILYILELAYVIRTSLLVHTKKNRYKIISFCFILKSPINKKYLKKKNI